MERTTSVSVLPGVGPQRLAQLREMGVETVGDLLQYIPFRYIDAADIVTIDNLRVGHIQTLHAEVASIKAIRPPGRAPFVKIQVQDQISTFTITFFHQPYIAQQLKVGHRYAFTGKVNEFRGKPGLTNPTVEKLSEDQAQETVHTGRVLPVYSQHGIITLKWLQKMLHFLLQYASQLFPEYLDSQILDQEKLMERTAAWQEMHFPHSIVTAEQARRRVAFDELWEIFASLEEQKKLLQQETAAVQLNPQRLDEFYKRFVKAAPFSPTHSQQKAIEHLIVSLKASHPFSHLIQGEVGSGKTLVAAFALLAVADQGFQALYLAPTTILAQQHFVTVSDIAQKLAIETSLWMGGQKGNATAPVIIGTHALIAKSAQFHPGIIIVDEEHRFGVRQREAHWQSENKPHRITMTATPIPRTLAHVIYGQQDISFLEPIPGKERVVRTRIFPPTKIAAHLSWLQEQIEAGSQAFVIAPLIEPSEAEMFADVFDATGVAQNIKTALPKVRVGLLTGKTAATEKERLLTAMKNHELDLLVATPVIEVGIDIPHASIITILSAERFGFAQLHQLRGRVGRQGQESWCFLVPSTSSISDRLKKMETIQSGNELAEIDLQLRGAGEFLGTQQSGWDGLQVATWMDLPLIEQVKRVRNNFHPKM